MGSCPFFFRRYKMLNRGLDKLELLRIVEAVANEKSIDKELVIGSMESAIQKAALTKFGNDNNIEVIIDRESGEIKIQKVLEIVEKVEDSAREISLKEAQKNNSQNKTRTDLNTNLLKLVRENLAEEHTQFQPYVTLSRVRRSLKKILSKRVTGTLFSEQQHMDSRKINEIEKLVSQALKKKKRNSLSRRHWKKNP